MTTTTKTDSFGLRLDTDLLDRVESFQKRAAKLNPEVKDRNSAIRWLLLLALEHYAPEEA